MKPSNPNDNTFLSHLQDVASEDAIGLGAAQKHYGNSWKKRGGIGAFMMLARKWDRLEKGVEEKGWDILRLLMEDGRGEGAIDDIRDLRRYLMLIEAEGRAMDLPCCAAKHRDNNP